MSFSPFLNHSLLFIILVLLISYFLLKSKLKSQPDQRQSLPDLLVNSFVIGILVWKLTPLLSQPSLLWTNPIALLYMQPAGFHIWLAVLISAIYLVISLGREWVAYLLLSDSLLIAITISVLFQSLFFWEYGKVTQLPWGISLADPLIRYHPLHVYQLLVALIGCIWFGWKGRESIGTGEAFSFLCLLWGLGLFLISFFDQPTITYLGLDLSQIKASLLIIIGYVSSSYLRKRAFRR